MMNIGPARMSLPEFLFRKFTAIVGPGRYTGPIMEQLDLLALDERLRTILPLEYQDRYEDVEPVSMGSAGIKYDLHGRVAWGDMWGSFCDLAMAGGPPHKGKLLEAASAEETQVQPEQYRKVVEEICRGIRMVADTVAVEPSADQGWVRMICATEIMAGWLARAIVMENVSVRMKGSVVELPAGPNYRIEKEIKNVITVVAKTCHYYEGHLDRGQEQKIGSLFAKAGAHAPLLQPVMPEDRVEIHRITALKSRIVAEIFAAIGLSSTAPEYFGWLGFHMPSVRSAIWMMRALVVSNVLARREGASLYVPVNPIDDPDGEIVVDAVSTVYHLAAARGVLKKDLID